MKKIKLDKDMVALVDDEDYEQLNKYKWCALKSLNRFCVERGIRKNDRVYSIYMCRQILGLQFFDGKRIDHINKNGLDNRKFNLRIVSHSQNQMNRRKIIKLSSQYKGVCWHKSARKWLVGITKNYRLRYLGLFSNEIDAACAYDEAAKKLFGEYARLNFED